MADKNWQASSKDLILARVAICFLAAVLPCAPALALSDNFAPASYVGSLDPNVLWEILIGVVVVAAFIAAIALWVHSALRKVRRSQVRRTAYISSALNSLSHGVVMTDPHNRIVYCNDRYLEIYDLQRSDLPPGMTGRQLLELRISRGTLDRSVLCERYKSGRHDHRASQRQINSDQAFSVAERRLDRNP
jgi:PAS domain-containing protein